jgi:LPXTG-motif cell wall-anchored protein
MQGVFSQDVKVSANLDTNAILIGDQVNMSISITFSAQYRVKWPVIGDSILGHIKVLSRTSIDTVKSKDKSTVKLVQRFVLTTFDSGFYAIPPVKFYTLKPPDTSTIMYQTDPVFLNVHTLKVDTTQAIKPIKGPMKVPISFSELIPWILTGIGIIILILLGFYYLRKRKKAEPIFQLKPRIKLQPHEIAFMELEKLRIKKLWQNGKIKEYHSELTEILRKYIEGRFSIMALEMTSEEIMEALKLNTQLTHPGSTELKRILEMADLVKFAKAQPLPAEHEACLADSINFINETLIQKDEYKEVDVIQEPVATK